MHAGVVTALATLVVATSVLAQVPFAGDCPDPQPVQNFSLPRYLGKWYEQERYFAVFQLGGNCVTATYTDDGDGTVGVSNEQFNLVTRKKSSIHGKATLATEAGEAKLKVAFPATGNYQAQYWVLSTDYDNYAIVWSCTSLLGLANAQFAWILTREKNPGLEVITDVHSELAKHKIELLPFRRTLQICEN